MLLMVLLAVRLCAQEQPRADIRTTVPLVLAPAAVSDKGGKPVSGLSESDFLLYDGATVRQHLLEVTAQPISVAICIQSNTSAGPALAKLVKVGSLILPLIAGESGAAAVLTYSDAVRVHQPFTSDADELTRAFRTVRPNGAGSRMLDAVTTALTLLEQRATRHRKVLIVIGESRDRSSESKLAEVLQQASRSNVTIYPVSFSVYLTAFTSRGEEHFGDKKDPGYLDQPRVFQAGAGPDLLGGLTELARLGAPNAAEALARATGGTRLSFARLKGLEEMIQKVGEDIHNQYLLSFTPGPGAPGYREIRVQLKSRPDLTVRARPGYWVAGAE